MVKLAHFNNLNAKIDDEGSFYVWQCDYIIDQILLYIHEWIDQEIYEIPQSHLISRNLQIYHLFVSHDLKMLIMSQIHLLLDL